MLSMLISFYFLTIVTNGFNDFNILTSFYLN